MDRRIETAAWVSGAALAVGVMLFSAPSLAPIHGLLIPWVCLPYEIMREVVSRLIRRNDTPFAKRIGRIVAIIALVATGLVCLWSTSLAVFLTLPIWLSLSGLLVVRIASRFAVSGTSGVAEQYKRIMVLACLSAMAAAGFFDMGCRLSGVTFPMGGGQYVASPNGRFEFHASNLADSVPWGRGYSYYEFEVIDLANDESIRRIVFSLPEGEEPIHYRSIESAITWNEDSSAATVPIARGVRITIDLPGAT